MSHHIGSWYMMLAVSPLLILNPMYVGIVVLKYPMRNPHQFLVTTFSKVPLISLLKKLFPLTEDNMVITNSCL